MTIGKGHFRPALDIEPRQAASEAAHLLGESPPRTVTKVTRHPLPNSITNGTCHWKWNRKSRSQDIVCCDSRGRKVLLVQAGIRMYE